MLTGIHILMTYKCNLECDHCFLYSGPSAQGAMTLPQIRVKGDVGSKTIYDDLDLFSWCYIGF